VRQIGEIEEMSNSRTGLAVLISEVVLGITACSVGFLGDCSTRNTTIPQVPIYPESVLVETLDESIPSRGDIWYTYQVQETPENVADFYGSMGTCAIGLRNSRLNCWGQADPLGLYNVTIEFDSDASTDYIISIAWDKSTSDWSRSIE
jgi:hypothetical protein